MARAADPGAAEDREAAEDHQVAGHPVVEAVAAMVVQELQPLAPQWVGTHRLLDILGARILWAGAVLAEEA
jgi:hypothetical protein